MRIAELLIYISLLILLGCGDMQSGEKPASSLKEPPITSEKDITGDDNTEKFLGRKVTPELAEKLKAALLEYPHWKDLISKTVGEVWVADNGTMFIGRWVVHPEDDTLKYCEGPRKIGHTYIAAVKYLEDTDKYTVENFEVMEYQLKDRKDK